MTNSVEGEDVAISWEDTRAANLANWNDRVPSASAEGKTVVVSTEVATLTPEEVARGLNLSRSTVSRRIASGAIRSVKVGNRHRVPYPEYRRLWEESMTGAVAASLDDVEAELFDAIDHP